MVVVLVFTLLRREHCHFTVLTWLLSWRKLGSDREGPLRPGSAPSIAGPVASVVEGGAPGASPSQRTWGAEDLGRWAERRPVPGWCGLSRRGSWGLLSARTMSVGVLQGVVPAAT